MPKRIFLREVNPLIEETLEGGGEVSFSPAGNSMLPMLRNRQDKIVLVQPPQKLKKYDIPLYRRENGQFVLHRVVAVKKDGYAMCGDNQWQVEYGVRHEQIIGVVTAFYRGNRYIECKSSQAYRLYSVIWTKLIPARQFLFKLRGWTGRVRNRLYAG